MKYTKLGKTGLDVSRLCIGCMSFGHPPVGAKDRHPWTLSEEESRKVLDAAWDAGINFFDTADVYSLGESERILGRWVKDNLQRDQVVITTKVHAPWRMEPNGKGGSRKNIITEVDKSLKNLQTDYIDVYMLHRLDDNTPIEETLETLNNLVRAGKVLYLGVSTAHAWKLMKAIGIQRANGWEQFRVMQNYYNLLYREEEREMIPLCVSEGLGITPWSPLARGRLARPWAESEGAVTERSKTDPYVGILFPKTVDIDKPIIDKVNELAAKRGNKPSEIAMAWLFSKPYVTSPLVGVSKVSQLDDAVSSLNVTLTTDEIMELESLYSPHPETAAFTR